jgi:hypothetical protein
MTTFLLPANKTKQILSKVVTGDGVDSVRVALEDNGAIITLFISEMNSGETCHVDIYDVGDDEDDKKLIFNSPIFKSIDETPYQMLVMPSGNIIIDVSHSDGISYVLRAKSISYPAPVDNSASMEALQNIHQQQLDLLSSINDSLEMLINHARIITGVNKDKGEDF